MNSKFITFAKAFLICFAFIISAIFVFDIRRTDDFNQQIRTTSSDPETSTDIVMEFRGGTTDSWVKSILDDNGDPSETLNAKIYEASLENTTSYKITEWHFTYTAKQNCYINNAWCGTIEIHQFRDGEELVQTLDLRNYSVDSISIDYKMDGQDLLIPLNVDDYIVYHPSTIDYENELPIVAGGKTTCGFIFYFEDEDLDFSDLKYEYHLYKKLTQNKDFITGIVLGGMWIVLLTIYIISKIMEANYKKELEEKEKQVQESIMVFVSFIDQKDKYTNGHSSRVANYSRLIAQELGMSEQEYRNVFYIALMHDCGKCGIPDGILNKPGKLTDEEFEVIKTHTTIGRDILASFSSINGISDGAMYHHERYDGKGYPAGKVGEDIPLIGRIICVADSFDAMNSARVYRKKMNKEDIIRELENGKGSQFDPKIVDIMLKLIENKTIDIDTAI